MHTFNLRLGWQQQAGFSKIEASLVYKAESRQPGQLREILSHKLKKKKKNTVGILKKIKQLYIVVSRPII